MADTMTAPPVVPPADRPGGSGTPPVWFVLPPGFTVLDVGLTRERLEDTAAGLVEDAGSAGVAMVGEAVAALAVQFEAYRALGITFAATGAHPAAAGGVDLSSLTGMVVPVPDTAPDTLVASLLMAETEQAGTTGVHERRYPAGPVVVAERDQTARPGGDTDRPGATDGAGRPIRVIRATVPSPGRTHVLVMELATAAVHTWEAYRDVFTELLLPTVTFEDPTIRRQRERDTRTAVSRLHNRLG